MNDFGKYYRSIQVQRYVEKYIPYQTLLILLEKMNSSQLNSEIEFYTLLDSSYRVWKEYIDEWISRLYQGYADSTPLVLQDILELNQFLCINQEALHRIISLHDSTIPNTNLMLSWKWKLEFQMLDKLVELIFKMIHLQPSVDAFEALSYHDDNLNRQEDTFIRESTKYWVHPNDIIPVLITIGKNLPLYCFGNATEPSTRVSSIYFDNFQRECYQARLLKTNGARIMRLRTYNDDKSKVFVERKVHYEKWTGDMSSKDRFCLKNEEILPFLKGQKVDLKKSQDYELFNELQDMIQAMQLHPVLRINYDRLAFQSPDHDHIRISIDLNMKFYREHTSHLEWYTEESKFTNRDIIDFPYAVVEIKLRDPFVTNRPKFIVEMEESSLLHKQNFFSKYLHAAYSYSLQEGTSKSLRIPPWWSLMKFTSPQFPFSDTATEAVNNPLVTTSSSLQNGGARANARPFSVDYQSEPASPHSAAMMDPSTPWFLRIFGYGNSPGMTNKVIKVEPKVFFSNERTFLSWFNSALFTGSIGIALTKTSGGRVPGGLLLLAGLIIIGYSILTYLQRTFSLVERKPTGYHDLYGPIILSVVIIAVFVLSYFL